MYFASYSIISFPPFSSLGYDILRLQSLHTSSFDILYMVIAEVYTTIEPIRYLEAIGHLDYPTFILVQIAQYKGRMIHLKFSPRWSAYIFRNVLPIPLIVSPPP